MLRENLVVTQRHTLRGQYASLQTISRHFARYTSRESPTQLIVANRKPLRPIRKSLFFY